MAKTLKKVMIESPADLRGWFEVHHATDESVWVVKWKKTDRPFVSYMDNRPTFGRLFPSES